MQRRVHEESDWVAEERRHHERVDALLAGHLARARRGEPHPVEDFLFTYYSFRPAQLRRWHPGHGAVLAGTTAQERLTWPFYAERAGGIGLDEADFLLRRGNSVRRSRDLLAATASRPAGMSCFALHEWAMVYRLPAQEVRHPSLGLRLGSAGTDAVVEQHRIRCTHFDAFRFFTAQASPLNEVRPSRQAQVALEQPGCLHATMDLYKIAYKLTPAVPGDLVADCFELAREVRQLDMRASPYDVEPLGYEVVAIETPQGKAAYADELRSFVNRAAVLREKLWSVCNVLLRGA